MRMPLMAGSPFDQGRKSRNAGYDASEDNPYPFVERRGERVESAARREWRQGFIADPEQAFAY